MRLSSTLARRPPLLVPLALALGSAACNVDGLLHEGAPAPATAALSLSLSPAAGGTPDFAVVEPGDQARILVTRPEAVVLDTMLSFGPAGDVIEAFLPVTIFGDQESLGLWVELRPGGPALLRGGATVLARRGQSTAVEVPLTSTADTPLEPAASISAGVYHGCALTVDGQAYCWGRNESGQLGDGGGGDTPVPVAVAGEVRFTSISAGYVHTCALDPDGRAYCWGSNEYGNLGTDSLDATAMPVTPVAAEVGFIAISTGGLHSCALSIEGVAHCWGYNGFGQLGDYSELDSRFPTLVGDGMSFQSVSAGYAHTCGLDPEGFAYCWGYNEYGQLGDGTTADSWEPVPVLGELRFRSITAGGLHSCAVDFEGQAYCWGRNNRGQLGDGTTADRGAPIPVGGGYRFVSLDAGGLHTCGVEQVELEGAAAGRAYCWGYNQRGALGDGSTTDSSGPVPVMGDTVFLEVDAGLHHTCGITPDTRALCWGYNGYGQLGNGSALDSTEPLVVVAPFAAAFAAGIQSPQLEEWVRDLLPGLVRDRDNAG